MCSPPLTPQAGPACGTFQLPILAPASPAYRITSGGVAAAILPLRVAADCLRSVRPSDPATRVMIDFSLTRAMTVPEHLAIDEAHDRMRRAGVRASLVLRGGPVIGLIRAGDIEAGRTMRLLRTHPQLQRAQVRVGDVAIPCEELPGADWDAIRYARVSDLRELFEAAGYSHLVVLERGTGTTLLRGLIARARLERQLGLFA